MKARTEAHLSALSPAAALTALREASPLVRGITSAVVTNYTANALLALRTGGAVAVSGAVDLVTDGDGPGSFAVTFLDALDAGAADPAQLDVRVLAGASA
ncbi:hypothetical protein [Microbacterium sp. E-13]|uniref:hypothetical protein n=1 Tax=Microbacterium sp. E-13 TaxID=3404048 RepID=UPI003CEC024A